MQLRNAMQNAPLQQQALQQQVQSGALDNQIKQVQVNDAKIMQSSMQQWAQQSKQGGSQPTSQGASAMPNYEDLISIAQKNGASASAIMGLQKNVLDMRDKASSIALNDAKTGDAQANAIKTKNGMLIEAMTGVINLPDDQIASGLISSAQDSYSKGLLDPQHLQQAQQLAQSGDPDAIRKQLSAQITGMGGFSRLIEDAQKKLDLQQKQQQADYYAQNGGTPGVPAETQELNSFLKTNPGKTAQDFVVWKAQHSPSVVVQNMSQGAASAPGNQLPGGGTDWGRVAQRYGLSQGAFDQQAEKYFQTGQLPPIGRGNANVIAQNRDLMNRAADLHPNASLAENSAEFKASSDSLKKIQTNFDQVNAFESTAEKNLNLLQQTAQNIPDLGAKFANVPVRMISGNMLGTENMARFKTALATAQTEAAKVLNSSNASGVLSDSARHELQDIIDGNAPYKTMVASLDTLRQDMTNRRAAYQDQINDIQRRLGKSGAGNSSTGNAGGVVTMRAPNGQTKSVSADQVEHYKQLGATVVQ
jgi:hypothetical protein